MSHQYRGTHVSDSAYAYQAALLCDKCGSALQSELASRVVEDDGDSQDFPQGPYPDGGGESDSAQFCSSGPHCLEALTVNGHKVGCPLRCPLTRDGADAVFRTVKSALVSPRKFDQAMGRVLVEVWGDYLDDRLERVLLPGHLPDLERLVGRRYVLHHVALAEPWHLYLLGFEAPGKTCHLLRVGVDDDGKLSRLDGVAVPGDVAEGYDAEKLLRQAVDDGAWE